MFSFVLCYHFFLTYIFKKKKNYAYFYNVIVDAWGRILLDEAWVKVVYVVAVEIGQLNCKSPTLRKPIQLFYQKQKLIFVKG